MKQLLHFLFLICATTTFAQVGINTTTPNAQLDIRSSNTATPSNTDGILIPKIDAFPATNLTAAQDAMLVYLTTTSGTNSPGFYYWNNAAVSWLAIKGSGGTLDQSYDSGGAGNGKTITADAGAVTINGTDGLIITGTQNAGANLDVSGAGVRMFFYPRRSAFRAGRVFGNEWDNLNIGDASFASGLGNTASGNSASAMGSFNTASAEASFAFGASNTANALRATAFGNNTFASGNQSLAFGQATSATVDNATAFGTETTASAINATAFGWGSVASGLNATAFGFETSAGNHGATAFGQLTNASADNATAFGLDTNASGNQATAFGSSTNATGVNATAFGSSTSANGFSSTSFGFGNTSSGDYTTTFGRSNNALGHNAAAFGFGNIAPSFAETVLGIGATNFTPTATGNAHFRYTNLTDRLFVIGNAVDANQNDVVDAGERSDAMVVLKNGLTRFPSMTNAMIAASDGKTVVTKEYLAANGIGTLDQSYDAGGAGAGRVITADAGPVIINGTDGFTSNGNLGSGTVNSFGTGVRIHWYPRKAAFRSGQVNIDVADAWNDINMGIVSTAFGFNTIASGDRSIAAGSTTIASGYCAAAFGNLSQASGSRSTAFGDTTVASGLFATAFGNTSNAQGNNSTAFGRANYAPSFGETVLGIGATTYTPTTNGNANFRTANSLDRLLVVGNAIDTDNDNNVDFTERSDALIILKNGLTRLPSTTNAMITAADGKAVVTKEYLTANTSGTLDQSYDFGGAGLGRTITADAGAVTIAGVDGFQSTGTFGSGVAPAGSGAIMYWNPRKAAFRAGQVVGTQWSNTNVGNNSVAFGADTQASGENAVAFGHDGVASGLSSFAANFNTVASGERSVALNAETTASGQASSAFNYHTTANGTNSSAFNNNTLASGFASVSFGNNTQASGEASAAFGSGTITQSSYSVAFGQSNTVSGVSGSVFGYRNFSRSFGETVIGIGATDYTVTTNGAQQFRITNGTDRLFVIGNAMDANENNILDGSERRDAFVVLKNGHTGIGTSEPQNRLEVMDANINTTSTNGGNINVVTNSDHAQNVGASISLGGRVSTGSNVTRTFGTIEGRKAIAVQE